MQDEEEEFFWWDGIVCVCAQRYIFIFFAMTSCEVDEKVAVGSMTLHTHVVVILIMCCSRWWWCWWDGLGKNSHTACMYETCVLKALRAHTHVRYKMRVSDNKSKPASYIYTHWQSPLSMPWLCPSDLVIEGATRYVLHSPNVAVTKLLESSFATENL